MSKLDDPSSLAGFQTVNYLAPNVDLYFDEEKERYICHMVSRSGSYELEGVNKNDITYQMDAILRDEYDQWTRRIENEREESKGMGRSRGGGSSSSKKEKYHGVEIQEHDARSHGGVGNVVEFVLGLSALSTGRYGDGIFSLMSSTFGGWFGGVLEIFGIHVKKRKIYTATVGGILVTAYSRRKLKKKLMNQKNKHIQRILMNVRMSRSNTTREAYATRVGSTSARIRYKREQALYLGKKSWQERVRKDKKPKKDWQGRVRVLKTRVQAHKEMAAEEWLNN